MKKKIGIVFGGVSTENDISIKSAKSFINNIDKNKYDIFNIFIDKENKWFKCESINDNFEVINKTELENVLGYLKDLDLVIPILHGSFGEDGKMQGFFETFNIPYVGCDLLSSSICMDKEITKLLLKNGNILQTNYICIKKYKDDYIYVDDGSRMPIDIIEFDIPVSKNSVHNKKYDHPTQKPVALCEYLIKTYTNEGEIVLDNCMGSGTTAIAAIRTKRQYIGFEIEKEYCDISEERLANAEVEAEQMNIFQKDN